MVAMGETIISRMIKYCKKLLVVYNSLLAL